LKKPCSHPQSLADFTQELLFSCSMSVCLRHHHAIMTLGRKTTQTPTLIGCILLRCFSNLAAISEAAYCSTGFFAAEKNFPGFFTNRPFPPPPADLRRKREAYYNRFFLKGGRSSQNLPHSPARQVQTP